VEEALIEMYLAGVSVRRVEDVTEALSTPTIEPVFRGRLPAGFRFKFRRDCTKLTSS